MVDQEIVEDGGEDKVGRDRISQGLLAALRSDEDALNKRYEEWQVAISAYDVAARRYAAMREAVRERLGVSPYAENVAWPNVLDATEKFYKDGRPAGRFRFVRMKIGDAVVEALQEAHRAYSLADLTEALNQGGLFLKDTRAVNAALINMKGVQKNTDGTYRYDEPAEDASQPW